MDENLLRTLGLTASEIAVYTAVLASGGVTPVALAKLAGVKRTTAYSIARSLIEKGLLVEDSTRRPRVFRSATPEQVLELVHLEKKRCRIARLPLRAFQKN
jgi:sugar-specific transcriptional regulator TrmB